jgi:hypothetical protein
MKITEKHFDIITGEQTVIEREETAEETQSRLLRAAEIAEAKTKAEAKAIEKAALLAKLGITDDEAKLLLS